MINYKKLQDLSNKKIALLGLGIDNKYLLSLLDKNNIKAEITICDQRDKDELSIPNLKNIAIKYQLGIKFNINLYKFDILFRSPGWPLFCPGIDEAKKHQKTIITNPLNLFFELCPTKNIIGITGTKGKGTTSSLIYSILKEADKDVFLGGNIGIAPLSFLEKIEKNSYVILELSSFQLEDILYSPHISIITNFYNEHLAPADPHNPNFHYSLNDYWKAKFNIAKHQNNNDYLIVNKQLTLRVNNEKPISRIKYFDISHIPSRLIGAFNKENIAAAVQVAKILNIPSKIYRMAIKNFSNLEHRLKFVDKINGIEYYDNSFATTPESTILDLESFNKPIILIAGGADKGSNFEIFAQKIKANVKYLILLPGGATPRIKKAVFSTGFKKQDVKEVKTMLEAVQIAKDKAEKNNIVLLSTACASFGIFKNYKERGSLFKKYVKEIK